MVPTLLDVNQLINRHPVFRQGGVRYEIFNENTNGMAELAVIVRNGRRVLIHEERYFLWLELKSTGELDVVIELLRESKAEGVYLTPEEAVARVRGRSEAAA